MAGEIQNEETDVQLRISDLSIDDEAKWNRFHQNLPKLTDLKTLYNAATLAQKHAFLRMVFYSNLSYSDGVIEHRRCILCLNITN